MIAAPPALQHPAELDQLLGLYRQRRPGRVLEVGVGEGGTLYHWLQEAPDDTTVVAIDIDPNARHVVDRLALELERPLAVYIIGDSNDQAVAAQAAESGPYDWIFIDADHHDHNVRRDWQLYTQLAAPGAVVALHDIKPSPDPTIQVDQLWADIKANHDTVELDAGPGTPGIGVVFMP